MSSKNSSLKQFRIEIEAKVQKAFEPFVDFNKLKKTKRKPKAVKTSLLYLRKNLSANKHDSGIENLGTDWMLKEIGRGMIRYSRRIAWLMRHYTWAARVPVLADKTRARVVDIGCDVAEIRKIMSASFYYPNPLYLGVDINHETLNAALPEMASRTPGLLVQHDVTFGLKFIKSGTVDCIFCGEIIEHFSEEYGLVMLKEMKRILKPGGVFFISTPCKKNSKGYKFHVYEYEPEELKKIIKGLGFHIIRSYGWVTTERVLKKRMSEKDRVFYEKALKRCHKDVLVPIMAHLNPNYGDAFCIEARK